MVVSTSPFIRACYGENDERIPIWIMRQAGRYLPEYRAVREKVSFVELCKSPDLIVEVVKQPIDRFDLDAAILFSDILTLLEPMGVEVSFPNGGPKISSPISEPSDVDKLHDFDIVTELPYVLQGVRQIKATLPDKPLIGFAGSPFTIACYLIEGQGSKTFDKAKRFGHQCPEAFERLIQLLTGVISRYLAAQIEAGADAVQLFQSWDGILSRDDYLDWSLRPANRIFGGLKEKHVPRMLFVNNLAPYVEMVRDVDCEVVGVDYRMDLALAAEALPEKSVQGNLDPTVLFGSTEHVKKKTNELLENINDYHRLIFNLGHGILPFTPIDSVRAMIDTVRNFRD